MVFVPVTADNLKAENEKLKAKLATFESLKKPVVPVSVPVVPVSEPDVNVKKKGRPKKT